MLTFAVPGVPVPKQSFRVGRNGGYRDPRVTAWQEAVAVMAKSALMGLPPLQADNLRVDITFHLPDRRRRDIDNLSKAVLDACNGILWVDDKQIHDLHLHKRYGKEPGIVVSVYYYDAAEEAA